jgi:antitoxin CptB
MPEPINAPESAPELAARRRQLGFRAWHRGTREADLLLGPFCDDYLAGADATKTEAFAQFLELEDPDIYDWVTGRTPIPANLPDGVKVVVEALCQFVEDKKSAFGALR